MNITTNKYNKDNFFENTYGVFKQLPLNNKELDITSNPDFISNSGSKYWYVGNKLYRYANHWDRVASCFWKIKGHYNANKNYKLGVIYFSKLEEFHDNINITTFLSNEFINKYNEILKMSRSKNIGFIQLYKIKKRLNFIVDAKYKQKYYNTTIILRIGFDFSEFNGNMISYKEKNYHLIKEYVSKIEKETSRKIDELIKLYHLK